MWWSPDGAPISRASRGPTPFSRREGAQFQKHQHPRWQLVRLTIDLYARHEIESSERAAAATVAGLIDSRLQGVSKERAPQG